MPPETELQTPPAEAEAPKPTPFEARLAELRTPATPPADPAAPPAEAPAGDPPADPAAEVVPEAGAPSETTETEKKPDAAPVELPGGATIVAKLPGQRPGDPDFEFTIDDELAEVLTRKGVDPKQLEQLTRQATNGFMRKQRVEAAREEIAADRAELDTVESALRTDPAGWMVERVPEPVRQETARKLLLSLSPEGWEAVMADVATWDKDAIARTAAATAEENRRLKADRARRTERDEDTQDTRTAKAIGSEITKLIPEDLDEGRADRLFDYAIERLRKHIVTNKLKRLDPAEVPQLMADLKVFEDFGVSPATAGEAPPAKPAATPPVKNGAGKEPPTREQVQKRVETRRAAAATAPAGAGAGVAASAAPPKGQTFEQRIAWLKGRK